MVERRRTGWIATQATATLAFLGAAGSAQVRPEREVLLPQREFGYTNVAFAGGVLAAAYLTDLRLGGPTPPETVRLAVLDREGRSLLDHGLDADVPDASGVAVNDVALAAGGTLVVSVVVEYGERRPESYLLAYDLARGQQTLALRTDPVSCTEIAADGAGLWCLGFGDPGTRDHPNDPHVVYRFSLEGELLDSFLAVSELSGSYLLHGLARGLVASGGSVAAWLAGTDELLRWSAEGGSPRCLVALAPDGREHGVTNAVAMLPDGTLIAHLVLPEQPGERSRRGRGLCAVDRRGRVTPVAGFPEALPYALVGSEGGDAVFFDPLAAKLLWFPLDPDGGT